MATFENNQDQTHIPQRQERLLPLFLQDIRQRNAIYNTYCDLANNTRSNDLSRDPFCQREEEKKGHNDQNLHN